MNKPSQDEFHLRVSYARASRWIRNEIEAGRQLKVKSGFLGVTSARIAEAVKAGNEWLDRVRHLLRRIFDRPDLLDEWHDATFDRVLSAKDNITKERLFSRCRTEYVTLLENVLKKARYLEELPSQAAPLATAPGSVGRQIFVVHGHDVGATEAVARLLMKLHLEPIILEEEVNKGRTIIEKLEASYLDVGYAVVIMTPDDFGAEKNDLGVAKEHTEKLQPRARQNVIMELGYSIGLLGRERVCALYRSGVERPSDYHDVVYILLDDAGAWKTSLAKELQAAGLDVDLNDV